MKTLCHYVACEEGQLSFDKGMLLAVTGEVDADWLKCQHGDSCGIVHRACVKGVEAEPGCVSL